MVEHNEERVRESVEQGIALLKQGNTEEALAAFGRAISIDPNNDVAYHSRSYAYVVTGEYAKAIADYNSIIAIDPNSVEAYNN